MRAVTGGQRIARTRPEAEVYDAAMAKTPALAILVAACSAAPPPATPSTRLSPTEHLARASLALRGVRPSLAELTLVAAEPGRLPALVDRYLDTPEFAATIRELHDAVLLL